ncbi:MAG: allantoicase [Calditrichaeota bacterium]|nr:MAG: allantoicase [Calditrichota bacterium]MBL1205054.1 allantoicase [Calditrichota bacterium]NOG44884.1 allantoicase [Calditrichota bacterium]
MNNKKPEFVKLTNLAAEGLGSKTLACSDDFFAPMHNLIQEGRGIFIADKYTENGKWMDGWESRRKRTPGNDWCIIKLAVPGTITGVDIDTNHFLGNHPPHSSIEGCYVDDQTNTDELISNKNLWQEILPISSLEPGSHNFYDIESEKQFTHLRLNIFPDGGVARLKVYGHVYKNWDSVNKEDEIDLASALNGGQAVLCNDMFFSHMQNLLKPERGKNMGDGWETKRNRTPGNVDWVIIKLAHPGVIKKVVIDTAHFKGNFPDSFMLQGFNFGDNNNPDFENITWQELLPKSKLNADLEHEFINELKNIGQISHVKLNIFPDGGISRLRLFGTLK